MKPTARVYARLLLLVPILFSSCSSGHRYADYPGVTFVSERGNPPAWTPVWSPTDPSKILINSSSFSGKAEVAVLNMATGKRTLLAQVDFGSVVGTSWSPDGKHVSLIIDGTTSGGSGPGLYILDVEDGSMRLLRRHIPGDVVWLSDGQTLVLVSIDLDPRRLVVSMMNTENAAERTVYTNPNFWLSRGASSSPDGKQLVLSLELSQDGPSDLYLLDLDSGKLKQLTDNGVAVSPAWSPKGGLIAYSADRGPAGQTGSWLHLIAPDGSCDIAISQLNDASYATWAPDGRRLAFLGPDGIYAVDLVTLLGRDINKGLCTSN